MKRRNPATVGVRSSACVALAACMVGVLCLSAPAQVDATVATIDGARHEGALTGLDGEAVRVQTSEGAASVPLDSVQAIRLAESADPWGRAGQALLLTRVGDALAARSVTLAEGPWQLTTELTGAVTLPVEAVSALLLPDARTRPEELREALAAPAPTEGDRLLILSGQGERVPVAGALRRIDAERITFHYAGQDRTIDRARTPLLRLAGPAGEPPSPRGWLVGRDGSRLGFAAVTVADGTVRLTGTAMGELAVPLERVAAIEFRSDRLVYLSQLTPLAVEQAGTFAVLFPWRADASSAAAPIRLAGRQYDRGLGLHSQARLRYALDNSYRELVALAGIDDAARPGGDAVLTILGDGRELLAPTRLRGTDAPLPIRLDLTGVETLEIRVDFGEALDVGDHVSLADARLIR